MDYISQKNLDNRLANFEKTLNTLGYIPIVSNLSGTGRIAYGSVAILAGNVSCAYKSCQYLITWESEA
jgi:hypothetical protein